MSKKLVTSREFSSEEIDEIIQGLFNFLHEKSDNIFVDDFLILEKQIFQSDIDALKLTNKTFKLAFDNAKKIESTKLKKYAAADRLNASFVSKFIIPD